MSRVPRGATSLKNIAFLQETILAASPVCLDKNSGEKCEEINMYNGTQLPGMEKERCSIENSKVKTVVPE